MNKIFKNEKYILFISIAILIILAIWYRFNIIKNTNEDLNNKEIVSIILREDEMIKALPNLVRDFNEVNEDIYIDLKFLATDYNNVVYTRLANEHGVDIVDYLAKAQIEKGYLRSLDSIDIDYSNLPEEALFKNNNEVIGVKYGSYIPKLVYNDTILESIGINSEEKPETLDELIYMLERIKEKYPDKIPLDISIANIHDLFSLLGNIAVSEDDEIYPTFWNYKTGEYDYKGLEIVLEKFKYMYQNELINTNFDTETQAELYESFQSEESVVTYITSSKKHSLVSRTFNLDISFGDIPGVSTGDYDRYYYTDNRILTISNNYKHEETITEEQLKHEEAIKEVYEWLLSDEVIEYLEIRDGSQISFAENPFDGTGVYDELSNKEGFNESKLDPTEVLAGNSSLIRESIYKSIRGEVDISEELQNLKYEMNDFIRNSTRNENINFELYKE